MPRLLGVYDLPGKTAAAIEQIRGRGYTDIVTYAPAPFAEVEITCSVNTGGLAPSFSYQAIVSSKYDADSTSMSPSPSTSVA